MGLYDRDYYRDSSSRHSSHFRMDASSGSMVKWIIALNVAVFLLQIALVRPMTPDEYFKTLRPLIGERLRKLDSEQEERIKAQFLEDPGLLPQVSIVTEWLKLDTQKVVHSWQVWRLLTCGFCHERTQIWHILVNMVILYWFGCTIEMMVGSREFLLFYLTGLLWASLAFIAMDLFRDRHGSAVGASGAVFAVSMLYTMHFPRQIIYLFLVIPVEMRWVMALYVLWDLHPVLLALSGDNVITGVAHAAHLGGAFFGFVYFKMQWRLERLFEWIRWPEGKRRRPASARPRLRIAPDTVPDPKPQAPPDVDADRLDQILSKISRTGQASLTEEEVALLKRASEELKNRRQKGEF